MANRTKPWAIRPNSANLSSDSGAGFCRVLALRRLVSVTAAYSGWPRSRAANAGRDRGRDAGAKPKTTQSAVAGVKHVVFLSSIGAQHSAGTGMIRSTYAGEQALRGTGLPVTFVRAAYFMENWAAVLHPVQADGVLPSFIAATQAIPMIASRDIGKCVAQALLDGPRGTRIIELSGPVEVSPEGVAAAFAKVLEREVKVAEAPLEAVVPTFTSFGISENVAGLFRELYEGVGNGKVDYEGGKAERRRGSTTIEDVARTLTGKQ